MARYPQNNMRQAVLMGLIICLSIWLATRERGSDLPESAVDPTVKVETMDATSGAVPPAGSVAGMPDRNATEAAPLATGDDALEKPLPSPGNPDDPTAP